jgi:hypothetical protein
MDRATSRKTTAATAAVVMVVGLSVILCSVIDDDLTRALGGACLTVSALTLLALVAIRTWITDTSEERRDLAAATREAQAEHTTYIAAKAALEGEQGRFARDMAAERARLAAMLRAEREALAAEFAEKRTQIECEAFELGWKMALSNKRGEHAKTPAAQGEIIHFPTQQPERARSRGHGVVGP